MPRKLLYLFLALAAAVLWTGCGWVDEDMSDCETDYELNYEMRLVTNMTTELETELSLAADINVSAALRTYLGNIFTDRAHDVDMSFYDVGESDARLHHEFHIMDANQSSYTLYIPVRQYMHLIAANLEQSGIVHLEGDGFCSTSSLVQQVRDTLPCQKTGIFTCRLPMNVIEGVDQQFNASLYMANCAAAVVLDTLGSKVKSIKAYADGFATGISIADSSYHFDYTPVIAADKLEVSDEPGEQLCFVSVNFPSRNPYGTKAGEDNIPWHFRVYSTLADGTVTETELTVMEPLRAGQLRILKAKVYGDGSLIPGDPAVGASVTLNWNPGPQHEIVI